MKKHIKSTNYREIVKLRSYQINFTHLAFCLFRFASMPFNLFISVSCKERKTDKTQKKNSLFRTFVLQPYFEFFKWKTIHIFSFLNSVCLSNKNSLEKVVAYYECEFLFQRFECYKKLPAIIKQSIL